MKTRDFDQSCFYWCLLPASFLPRGTVGRGWGTEEPAVRWGGAAFLSWGWPCRGQRCRAASLQLRPQGPGQGWLPDTEGEPRPWSHRGLTVGSKLCPAVCAVGRRWISLCSYSSVFPEPSSLQSPQSCLTRERKISDLGSWGRR